MTDTRTERALLITAMAVALLGVGIVIGSFDSSFFRYGVALCVGSLGFTGTAVVHLLRSRRPDHSLCANQRNQRDYCQQHYQEQL